MTNRPGPVALVVDDEEDLRDIIRRMLERRGFRTISAAGADAAVEVCRDHPGVIDLLATDLGVSGVTGSEFRSAVLSFQPRLRVVFISSQPRETAVLSGLVTADDIVLKTPFSAESLLAALRVVTGEVV